ncbi:MAG: hypothetical protein M1358_00490 [Chloroflexi bacterium]|nr:hypothetical protein [Chloroflexota bacterium]
MAGIVRRADALMLRSGVSFGIAAIAGGGGGGGTEFVTNLRSGEASVFVDTQAQLEAGVDLGLAMNYSFGLIYGLPSNATYSGVFWGSGGSAVFGVGPTGAVSAGMPGGLRGDPVPTVSSIGVGAGLRAGANVSANVSAALEVRRDTADSSIWLPALIEFSALTSSIMRSLWAAQ